MLTPGLAWRVPLRRDYHGSLEKVRICLELSSCTRSHVHTSLLSTRQSLTSILLVRILFKLARRLRSSLTFDFVPMSQLMVLVITPNCYFIILDFESKGKPRNVHWFVCS